MRLGANLDPPTHKGLMGSHLKWVRLGGGVSFDKHKHIRGDSTIYVQMALTIYKSQCFCCLHRWPQWVYAMTSWIPLGEGDWDRRIKEQEMWKLVGIKRNLGALCQVFMRSNICAK